MLEKEGVLYRDPLIETVPGYRKVGTLDEVCRELGLSPDLADFAACGLFDRERRLYAHQRDALKAVAVNRKSMVVTTGTGSGKTECFMLPILESLVRESRSWSGPERPRAVRALILYPLNALVEDQMTRLRRAFERRHSRRPTWRPRLAQFTSARSFHVRSLQRPYASRRRAQPIEEG